MPSGTHCHLKRIAAPPSWGLASTEGTFATRPLPGGFSKKLSIPVKYIIAKFLQVATNGKEIGYILKSKMIAINGKDVVSHKTTVGLFDVVTVKKTNQHFRLIFNVQRKFKLHRITAEEAQFRLTKVSHKYVSDNVPYTCSIDGYNFRFVNPSISPSDTLKVDIKTRKVVDSLRFEAGHTVFVYGGSNIGRVGVIKRVENIGKDDANVYLEDANGKSFTVLRSRSIVIGTGKNLWMTLDESAGIKLTEFELSNIRYADKKEVEIEDN